jgi:hypothetical protein
MAAAIHGVGGDLLVVRKLAAGELPSTRFGGPRMTMSMIHVTWHVTTVAFLSVGVALVLAGSVLDGDAAQAIAVASAIAATGFAAVALLIGGVRQSPRAMFRHPGPLVLTAVAAFAWLGAL